MNAVLKIFLSMSVSGSLLILILLLGKRLLKDKISRQWQYYIWLVVIFRLLLPFGPEVSLLGRTYQAVEQVLTRTSSFPADALWPEAEERRMEEAVPRTSPFPADAFVSEAEERHGEQAVPRTSSFPGQQWDPDAQGDNLTSVAGTHSEKADNPAQDLPPAAPFQDMGALLAEYIWLIWLAAALGMLIRKVTMYQSFVRYIHAGLDPVSDIEILDRLSCAAERAGVKKPIELCVNPLISSPLLLGFFRPCIVLPRADIPEKDFQYIVLHELTHYRRRDLFYKWLVQVTVCLHWFNPLVYLMSREIAGACEFSCDEAVLAKMGSGSAQEYGKTLLDAMAAVGKYRENFGVVTLSENVQLLKERLKAIMGFKTQSKGMKMLTAMLTLFIVLGASFVGIYSSAAADAPDSAGRVKGEPSQPDALPVADDSPEMETLDFRGTTYYLVFNEAQLRAIGTGEYGMDRHYMQQADIALSADEWVPIGTWDNPFTGTFTGNGYEIKGLTMTDPDAEIVGLFGVAVNAHIYNVVLRDYDIAGAGRNAVGKSVGPILAVGQEVRSYDNFAYPAGTDAEEDSYPIEEYYEAGSLPLFQKAFAELDEADRGEWLNRIYTDGNLWLWGVAVGLLEEDCALIRQYAEKTYGDGSSAWFSVLARHMSRDTLEEWLDKALEDDNWAFQSVLLQALGREDELDEWEKEWEEKQAEEYRAAGIFMDGKKYYYQGELVRIFLDIVQPDKSFYMLNMNPEGAVDIKIVRDEENKITGIAYMTEEEVTELFGDMEEPEEKEDVEIIPVDFESISAGEDILLGEYTLLEGDGIRYDIYVETGNRIQVYFAKKGQKNVFYWAASILRQPGEELKCMADFTVESPAGPGTYQLYLKAPEDALGKVKGSVSIER